MRKLIVILLLIAPIMAFSQFGKDYGFKIGIANYLGEFGGNQATAKPAFFDIKMGQSKLALGFFGRMLIKPKFAINAGFNYLSISGADNLSTNPARVGRNLNFKNTLLELYFRAEYYFFQINDVGHTGRYQLDFKAYGFLGLGITHHNPKGLYQGNWYSLRPLKTEGVKYSSITMAIPMGMGFYYTYKKVHRFGWEFNWRMTFTDYLDDVSTVYVDHSNNPFIAGISNQNEPGLSDINPANYQPGSPRGSSSANDSYLTSTFYYSHVIKGKSNFVRSRYNYVYGGRKRRKRKSRPKF